MHRSLILSSLVVTSLFAATACADKSAKPAEATAEKATAEKAAKPHPVLDAYEDVRVKLAADQIAEAVKASAALAAAADGAGASAKAETKPHVEALAKAAKELSGKDAANADDVRKQFGEVSRALMALLAADPSLAEGRHAFECPMAQGYKKWVQASADMANPYMGKRMLKCGSTTSMSL